MFVEVEAVEEEIIQKPESVPTLPGFGRPDKPVQEDCPMISLPDASALIPYSRGALALQPSALSPLSLSPIAPPPPSQHAPSVYVASLTTHHSRRAMRAAIEHIAEILTNGRCDVWTLPWGELRFEHTAAVRARLIELQKPATVKRKISALKGVLRAAWRLGQIEIEDYHKAIDLDAVKGVTLPRGRMVPPGELAALIAACVADPTPAGARDAGLLAMLAGCGLRRSEAVALTLDDYEAAFGAVTVREGKGHKERMNYVRGGAQDAVEYWLSVRGPDAGPLFLPTGHRGKIYLRQLSDQTAMDILSRRCDEVAIRHYAPHDLRHTYITNLLGAGIDIHTVSRMVGHASVETTKIYDRRGEDEKQNAASALHFPFRRPQSTPALPL